MPRLAGHVAIVTGAGSGIGRAIAARFVAEGAKLLVADIDRTAGERVAAELGDAALFQHLDVARDEDWTAAVDAAQQRFGWLSIVVNNAGVSTAGSIATTTRDAWQRTLDVNATGSFLGCKHAVAAMGEAGGSIINIASARALRPSSGQVAYSASKALVVALTQSVALHCGETGLPIRCNALCPGVIDTPILEETRQLMGGAAVADARLAALHPLGRLGKADEIAAAALFLASDEAGFVTGATISVDGGFAIRDK
jgi:3alpha(or 20beta)-hydroxysteroid dehydrogenase